MLKHLQLPISLDLFQAIWKSSPLKLGQYKTWNDFIRGNTCVKGNKEGGGQALVQDRAWVMDSRTESQVGGHHTTGQSKPKWVLESWLRVSEPKLVNKSHVLQAQICIPATLPWIREAATEGVISTQTQRVKDSNT